MRKYTREQVRNALKKVLYEESIQNSNSDSNSQSEEAQQLMQQQWQEQLSMIPSPIKIGQQVLIDFGDNGKLNNFVVKCVDFSNDGIKYTCVNQEGAVIHRISAQYVRGLI